MPAPLGTFAAQVPHRRLSGQVGRVRLAGHREETSGHVPAVGYLGERTQVVLELPEDVRLHATGTARRHVGVRPVKLRAAKLAIDEGGQ